MYALLLSRSRPFLEPARLRSLGFDAGLMAEEPEQDKIGVDLAVHHGFKVKLHIGLAHQAHVIAEDSES